MWTQQSMHNTYWSNGCEFDTIASWKTIDINWCCVIAVLISLNVIDIIQSYKATCEICKNLWATSPISSVATEQAGPRIISLVVCEGSVCWMRWYTAGITKHYMEHNRHLIVYAIIVPNACTYNFVMLKSIASCVIYNNLPQS